MWDLRRAVAIAAAVTACWLLSAATAVPGNKKIEQLKEKGEFTADTPKDREKTDCPCKLYALKCVAGRTYTIDLRSDEFDAYLRLEDPKGKTIAVDDDSGGGSKGQDARIIFKADKTATYTIAATSFNSGAKGKYTLTVTHDGIGSEVEIKYLLDVKDKLTKSDPKDKDRGNHCYMKKYKIEMKAKTTYVIQLDSADFDAFLRLLDPDGKQVAEDDDGAKEGLNAKIVYECKTAGTFTIIATSAAETEIGAFHLRAHAK
jgi:serine protease Do